LAEPIRVDDAAGVAKRVGFLGDLLSNIDHLPSRQNDHCGCRPSPREGYAASIS